MPFLGPFFSWGAYRKLGSIPLNPPGNGDHSSWPFGPHKHGFVHFGRIRAYCGPVWYKLQVIYKIYKFGGNILNNPPVLLWGFIFGHVSLLVNIVTSTCVYVSSIFYIYLHASMQPATSLYSPGQPGGTFRVYRRPKYGPLPTQ